MKTPIKITEKDPGWVEISSHNSEKILQYVFIFISVGSVVILFLAFDLLGLATCLIFIGLYFLLFHNFDIIPSKHYQIGVDTEQKLVILDNGTILEYSEKDKLVLNNALSK